VLAAEEEQHWNRSKGVREAKFVETCEGVQVQTAGTICILRTIDLKFFNQFSFYLKIKLHLIEY